MDAPTHPHQIIVDAQFHADDRSLQELLTRVYVGGRFTDAAVAADAFIPTTVRARGQLFWCRSWQGHLLGMVMLVPPTSAVRRLASAHEAELHLLAVDPSWRGRGVGAALVSTVLAAARQQAYRGLVLWTQPTMAAAHRLYTGAGFIPSPQEDFERGGRHFRVLRLQLG